MRTVGALALFRWQFGWALSLAALVLSAGRGWAGSGVPRAIDDFQSAFFDDATFTLHARSYLFDEVQSDSSSDPAAWALGGWMGYQTAWIGNVLQFGAVAYTTQPLWAPAGRPGSQLLLPGQQGFSVLGQAYAALRLDAQTLTLYRQIVDQPEVNEHDTRMVPNTFEGGTLAGGFGPLSYFGGVLTAMKTRDADTFVNMADVAGVSRNEDMVLGSLELAPADGVKLRSSAYAVPNVLASNYNDVTWRLPITPAASLDVSGQYMLQGGIGDQLLTGAGFRPWIAGLKGDLGIRSLTLTAGYTVNGTDDTWQSPYGVWPGFTHMMIKNFYRAGEHAVLLGAGLDGNGFGLPGLQLTAGAALDTAIGDGQTKWNEYDVTALYRPAAADLPWQWLSPLQLEGRYGHLDEIHSDGSHGHVDELRIVLDYQLQFTGGQFRE